MGSESADITVRSEAVAKLRAGAAQRGRLVWAVLAVALAAAGVTGSLLGARAVATVHAEHSRRALTVAAQQIAAGVRLAIQREGDLITSTSALVGQDPDLSEARLLRWLEANHTRQAYPELGAIALVRMVPASRLTAFEAHVPALMSPRGAARSRIMPAGARSYYCLSSAGAAWGFLDTPAPGWLDVCALPGTRMVLLGARDSGVGYALATPYLGQTLLAAGTPIYRGAVAPATVAGRRHAFLGWLGETILPRVVLSSALRGHPGTALQISYHRDGYHTTFNSGPDPVHAGHVAVALGGSWTVRVSAGLATTSLLDDVTALGLLIGGIALSLLLAALVYVLASGRARARRLVSEKTAELAYLALHDALTGLPNRVLALDRAEQLLARARRTGNPLAALYIDIDGFKHINDSYGHAAGDRFLQQVADRLRGVVRENDTAARLAGDEFLVLLDAQTPDPGIERVAERLLTALREPYDLAEEPGRRLTLTASIGLALGYGDTAEQLLADADLALYAAKAAGRNRYVPFQADMQTATQERLALELDLADATERGQLHLLYQPIYDLSTERAASVEALLRWHHPTRGMIAPDTFIPLAEQSGHIIAIGRWVLIEACRQAARWHAHGHPLVVAVNISGRQLDDDDLIDHVRDALTHAGLDPSALMLEITETALMTDPATASTRLAAIRALGVKIAIDDFGTGYSSLAYLRQFPVDIIKVDRSFVNAIDTSPESDALINTLIQLAKTLNLKTVGEGIEDHTQLHHLQAEGCDYGQGFLFARPLEPDQVTALLHEPHDPAPTIL